MKHLAVLTSRGTLSFEIASLGVSGAAFASILALRPPPEGEPPFAHSGLLRQR